MKPLTQQPFLVAHDSHHLAPGNRVAFILEKFFGAGNKAEILLAVVNDEQVAIAAQEFGVDDLAVVDGGDFRARRGLDVNAVGKGGNAEFCLDALAEQGCYRASRRWGEAALLGGKTEIPLGGFFVAG